VKIREGGSESEGAGEGQERGRFNWQTGPPGGKKVQRLKIFG